MSDQWIVYSHTECDDEDDYTDVMDAKAVGPFPDYKSAFEYQMKHLSEGTFSNLAPLVNPNE